MDSILDVPAERQPLLERICARLLAADRIALTTHVNADGDGAGSEIAIATWLDGHGKHVRIVNPTPFPDAFRFLVPDAGWVVDGATVAGEKALAEADVICILDTAEASRIGRVAKRTQGRDVVVIDHHVANDQTMPGLVLQDANACATGELVYDLLRTAAETVPWAKPIRHGIYTAIVTDTGSFRFSNTTRRAHAIAGDLIEQGVDPEHMYRSIYATVPLRRIELLRHALQHLQVDPEYAITWITIDRDAMEHARATTEDLDGIVDHARSIEGTEVAILFRETSDGATKVSLRSAGEVNVNAIARRFGGGGHIKASGALMREPLPVARELVLDATRAALRDIGAGFRTSSAPA